MAYFIHKQDFQTLTKTFSTRLYSTVLYCTITSFDQPKRWTMKRTIIAASRYHVRSCSSASPNPNNAPAIRRHGPGDGVITLNVGGKKFQTLRSTVAQNEVLMDHVFRAEANAELSDGEAIFIDRDPAHFAVILTYLRNKADGVYTSPYAAKKLMKFGSKHGQDSADNHCKALKAVPTKAIAEAVSPAYLIQLPKDSKILKEIYFESKHYNITELTDHICSRQVLTRIFSGMTNPFEKAATAIAAGKRFLVLLGTMMTGMGGWGYSQARAGQAQINEIATEESRKESSVSAVNQVDFWKEQHEIWKTLSELWSGSSPRK